MNFRATPVLTLNILAISFYRFYWRKAFELSFSSASSKDESKTQYTTRKALMRSVNVGI